MVTKEEARRELLSRIPGLREQQRRFEEVFGKEVSEKISRAERAFRQRGAGRPGPRRTVAENLAAKAAAAVKARQAVIARQQRIKRQQEIAGQKLLALKKQRTLAEAREKFLKRVARKKARRKVMKPTIRKGKVRRKFIKPVIRKARLGVTPREMPREMIRPPAKGEIIISRPTGRTFRGVPIEDIVVISASGKERKPTAEEEKLFLQQQKTVEPIKKERALLGRLQKIEEIKGKLRTERLRGKKQTLRRELKLAGLTFVSTLTENVIAFKDLPKTAKEIVKDPAKLKKVPTAIKRAGGEFGELLRVSPTEAITKVGTEILLLKATAKGFEKIGKGVELGRARLSPKFVGKAKTGKTLEVLIKDGKRLRKVKLKVVGRIGSKSLPPETLAKKVGRAGKRVDAVSTQADRLVGFIRRKKIIRKPIPGEAKFSKATKSLLKKFDDGTINQKQLIQLDDLIQKQGEKGILERSFFVDPEARIRPSRIGVEQRGSLLDLLSGDVTFRKPKPQILLFEKAKVERLPKALKSIERKLRQNKVLTKTETNRFLKFQLTESGKFKPIGFASREPELTLAPGEIIKRQKTVGVTIINGRRVPIVKVKVLKPKGKLKKLLDLAKKKPLSKKQSKTLNRLLKKQTGFNYKVPSSGRISKKVVSIKRIGASVTSRIIFRKRKSKISKRRKAKRVTRPSRPRRKISRPRRPFKPSRPSRPSRRRRRIKISRVSKARRVRKPSRPRKVIKISRIGRSVRIGKPVKVIRPPLRKIKKKRKKPKLKQGYIVFGKSRGKFLRLNKKPLSEKNALNRGAFAVDHTTARTFKIKRVGKFKKLGRITKQEGNYFKRTRKKYRRFKIKKGVKRPLVRKYIERKGRGLIDTRGEKRGLTLRRLIERRRRGPLRKKVKKPKRRSQKRNGNIRRTKKKKRKTKK